ncbi:transporter substrate-binding domain-containing protein [Ottowia sp. GY511]|uniref:Transporter substrate-binding domain-containing protein n=1 Tax=Ottowia flava TaxID=2675430 RepID=A0ABW4KWS9_9BURK|nr:transporter substrate-binding domain-containing protein [Ottowia sp. GY511]TXK28539.1 transporter substrate-binding domain-containing protein [Ottowia sp. GY511]
MRPVVATLIHRAVLCAAVLSTAPAFAQSAPADTLAKIAASKSITLGVRKDAQPFSYLDGNGKPAGFSWGLCQAIVQHMSEELKAPIAVKFEPVSLFDSFSMLKDGKIDLHCGITSNTAARAELVDFSDTFYVSRVVAAYRAGDTQYASPREFGRTGVLRGSTAQGLMKTYAAKKAATLLLGPVREVSSYGEGVQLLKNKTIDTLVADELMIPKDPALALRREQLTVEPYALVMRKGDRALQAAVDRAMQKVLSGTQGKQLAISNSVQVDHMTTDAWRKPSKQPAPPVL